MLQVLWQQLSPGLHASPALMQAPPVELLALEALVLELVVLLALVLVLLAVVLLVVLVLLAEGPPPVDDALVAPPVLVVLPPAELALLVGPVPRFPPIPPAPITPPDPVDRTSKSPNKAHEATPSAAAIPEPQMRAPRTPIRPPADACEHRNTERQRKPLGETPQDLPRSRQDLPRSRRDRPRSPGGEARGRLAPGEHQAQKPEPLHVPLRHW
jgi:hypothetical protein